MAETIDSVAQALRDASLQVHNAQENVEEREVVVAAHAAVARVNQNWKALLEALPEKERTEAERNLGRRVQDLRRMAALLPRAPQLASESTPDRQSGGGAVGERRITGVSWRGGDTYTVRPALRVGGEVESWCGKCLASTTHHIVAIVDGEPRQVVCQVCNGRHNHRTGPARKKDGEAGARGSASSGNRVPLDPQAERRAEAQRALSRELATAEAARAFDPKERYKAGEIISHPEFGRGKIENVLRASLLVRFSSGLKSVMLIP